VTAAALVCAPARADEAERARAEQDFKQALVDEEAGQYDKAAGELIEARALAHKDTPQLLFHLGVCHAHMGKVILARDELRAASERAQGEGLDNVALTARAQLEQVQGRVGALTLARPAHGTLTAVTLDGVDVLAKVGVPIDVDPGKHTLQASYSDGAPARLETTIVDGERKAVTLPDVAPAASPGDVSPPPPPPVGPATPSLPETTPESRAPSSRSHLLAWSALGAGAALVAGGAVSWILRGNAIGTLNGECGASHQSCPASASGTISNGKLYDTLGVALFVAGGATLLTGGSLFVFGGSSGTPMGARLTPSLSSHGGSVGLAGAFW
jgi:hypothetical protein